jgi:hypothetical protein
MANPLFDQLFGKHAGKTTPFLHLTSGPPSPMRNSWDKQRRLPML